MIILLDIDGVMVTTPPWRAVEQDSDGFMKFDERAAANLAKIVNETNASIVLTTTHRVNYSIEEWKEILNARGIFPVSISKVNENDLKSARVVRADEVWEWIEKNGKNENFVVIDDDSSINDLSPEILKRCVITRTLNGLDDEATARVLKILKNI